VRSAFSMAGWWRQPPCVIGVAAAWLFDVAGSLKMPWFARLFIGGVAGLIISFFARGIVLMVLGWIRAAKRLK